MNAMNLELLQLEAFAAENPDFLNSVEFLKIENSEYAYNTEELEKCAEGFRVDENFP